jgi:hypothetical protein
LAPLSPRLLSIPTAGMNCCGGFRPLSGFSPSGLSWAWTWHSSGITTSVIGALKRGLTPLGKELGVHVCGGRGKHSRQTPQELLCIGDRVGIDGAALAQASRLVAKVDSAAVQDGFDLYLHGFIVTDDGKWAVVQQGMNGGRKQARRYHWLSDGLTSFVDDPHVAIEGRKSAVRKVRLGCDEELGALQRLDEQARKLEHFAGGPGFDKLMAEELDHSHSCGGRSVFGWEPAPATSRNQAEPIGDHAREEPSSWKVSK